jgi:hypothetical protein
LKREATNFNFRLAKEKAWGKKKKKNLFAFLSDPINAKI